MRHRDEPEKVSWPHIPHVTVAPAALRTWLVCRACQHLLTAAASSHHAGASPVCRSPPWAGGDGGVKAGTDCESGGSSAAVAQCTLVDASQKLKHDPALPKQFSFEKPHICLRSFSFREQKVSLVQDALVVDMASKLA